MPRNVLKDLVIDEQDVPTTVIAEDIRKISIGMQRLFTTGLTQHAIAVLVKDATGVPMHTTKMVLAALPTLAERYTIKPKKAR